MYPRPREPISWVVFCPPVASGCADSVPSVNRLPRVLEPVAALTILPKSVWFSAPFTPTSFSTKGITRVTE